MRQPDEPSEPDVAVPSMLADLPLSQRLRTATAEAHRDLEVRTGWPGTLTGAGRLVVMLGMFRALHGARDQAVALNETTLRRHGFAIPGDDTSDAIDADLRGLGAGAPRFPVNLALETGFDSTLGLVYVAAGSALGNVLILRHVEASPDPALAAASRFLRRSAGRAGPDFRRFRMALDRYGALEPDRASAVIAGAIATFQACAASIGTLEAELGSSTTP